LQIADAAICRRGRIVHDGIGDPVVVLGFEVLENHAVIDLAANHIGDIRLRQPAQFGQHFVLG